MAGRKFEVFTDKHFTGPVGRFRSSVGARKLARRLALSGRTAVVLRMGMHVRTLYAYTPGGERLPL